jgi:hypothetical protein
MLYSNIGGVLSLNPFTLPILAAQDPEHCISYFKAALL